MEKYTNETYKGKYTIYIDYSILFHKKYLSNYPHLITLNKNKSEKYEQDFILDYMTVKFNFQIQKNIYLNVEEERIYIRGNNFNQLKEIANESKMLLDEEEQKLYNNYFT